MCGNIDTNVKNRITQYILLLHKFSRKYIFMAETEVKIASAGGVQRMTFNALEGKEITDDGNNGGGGNGGEGAPAKTPEEIEAEAKLAEQTAFKEKLSGLDDEQLKELLKGKGIEFAGSLEEMKEKLKPVTAAETPEELAKKEEAVEKRMLDLFVANGGKVEQFVDVKKIMTADLSEISKQQLKDELIEAGVDETEVDAVVKQMFLQEDLATIEQDEDETAEQFEARKAKLEKKVKYGAEKLANRSSHIQAQAKGIYEGLKKQVEKIDSDTATEAALQSSIDTHLQTVPREMKIEVGKVTLGDNVEIEVAPIDIKIPEEAITALSEQLKDPKQRDALFYDTKGNLDIAKISELYLRNKVLETAVKSSYIKGETNGATRQVEEFRKRFPSNSAYAVGVGGAATKHVDKTAVASTGKPQRMQPQR